MRTNLLDEDTLLTTTYCLVDDNRALQERRRHGPPPAFSDGEVLTLCVLAQLLGLQSERNLIRYAREHWLAFFPRLITQSEFNRRARRLLTALTGIAVSVTREAVRAFKLANCLEVIDGTAVPLMRRCRASKERLFTPDAGFGRGGSDREQYYGLKLLLSVNESGFITGFVAGPGNTEERWLAEAFLRWRHDQGASPPTSEELRFVLGPTHKAGGLRRGPSGQLGPACAVGHARTARGSEQARDAASVFLADLNYRGSHWQEHWLLRYDAMVLTAHDLREAGYAAALPAFHSLRHVVEGSIKRLIDLGLRFPLARSLEGAWQRLAAKVAAHNVLLTINLLNNRPLHATT